MTTNSKYNLHNKGLWRLSGWSRRTAGASQADPHLPALRRRGNETPTQDNVQKVQILTEKFFPATGDADLSDIIADSPEPSWLGITHVVTKQELLRVVKQLPTGRAPGPDGIPNEILKLIIPLLADDLAQAISQRFASGSLP
jgi:hypothetical protein